jgi:hypothetical protein
MHNKLDHEKNVGMIPVGDNILIEFVKFLQQITVVDFIILKAF